MEREAASGGAVFGVVVGFVAGVLAAALIIPSHSSGSSTAGLSASSSPVTGAQPGAVADGTAQSAGTTDTSTAISPASGAPAAGSSVLGAVARSLGAATGTSRVAAHGAKPTTTTKVGVKGPVKIGGTSTGGQGPAATGPVQGVTADAITIGVAYPDLTALKTLGAEYDNGDVPGQWDALKAGWIQKKLLPIDGRTINFVYKSFNVLDTNDQNAACTSLVQDSKVFAVIGVAYFEVGDACVAGLHTPVITSDGPSDASFKASAPYLYSLSASDSKILRNMVHWAENRGALKGKTVGVYYTNDASSTSEAQTQVIDVLTSLGHPVVTDSTGQSLGGPEDAIAAQKFRSSNVGLVILLTSEAGFQQQAKALGYKPTFIDSDHFFGTSDVTTSTYPSDEFDGTFGMTGRKVGEAAAGMPASPDTEACLSNYEKQSGTTVARPGSGGHQGAVYAYVLTSCDLGKVVLTALGQAGRALSATSYLAGFKTISNMSLTNYSPVTFTSRPDGGTQQRTVQWTANCTCWHAIGSFAPFPSP